MSLTLGLLALTALPAADNYNYKGPTDKEFVQKYWDDPWVMARLKPEFDHGGAWAAFADGALGFDQTAVYTRVGNIRKLKARDPANIGKGVDQLRQTGKYLYLERNHLRQLNAPLVGPDPEFSQQWALANSAHPGCDISAVAAWKIQPGAPTIIVAMVDGGVNEDHPDLSPNLAWLGLLRPPGWGSPHGDDVRHGTLVAGIVGAARDNGVGVAGVASPVKLLPLRFTRAAGFGGTCEEVECIEYAIQNGAKVINCSFSYSVQDRAELDALRKAGEKNIIVVVAAGNKGQNIDIPANRCYPACYPLDNLVVVAATTETDGLWGDSNWGPNTVALGAPGFGIYSTDHLKSYDLEKGTSMAAPHVAGALALLCEGFPKEDYRNIIRRLVNSIDRVDALKGKVNSGGRLNLANAVAKP